MVTFCLISKIALDNGIRRFKRTEWPEDKAEEKKECEIKLKELRQEYNGLCIYRNMVIAVTLCGVIPYLFIPDSKSIAAIAVVPRLIESDAVQKDIPQLYRAAVDYMVERLNDRGDKK